MALILVLCVSIACGIVCHLVARKRGLKPVFWGIMGVMFGPLAIPFVYLAGPAHDNHR